MKALLLAAGLGTRLKPLTDHLPKALVSLAGKPMIEWVILKLIALGVDELIINLHYLGEQLEEFIHSKNSFGIRIVFSDERQNLLDTGGAIRKAAWFFDDHKPFLVHNTDVFCNANLTDLLDQHRISGNLVTMAVKQRPSSRNLLIDRDQRLCGWSDNRSGKVIEVFPGKAGLTPLAFSGIQVIDPELFSYIPMEGAFPIIPLYLRLAKEIPIGTWRHDSDYWFDLGSIKNLKDAEALILANGITG
jgi:N-acetyl-alpha-D-muramate 1-phosphate uridylyltransferase